jgi:hypothetical protein
MLANKCSLVKIWEMPSILAHQLPASVGISAGLAAGNMPV